MLTRYVRSFDGASLAVTLHGDERDSPTIVVSPWATTSGGRRVSLADQLAVNRYVARYDRRGTGASGRDAGDLGLNAQVGDVGAVADALGLGATDVLAFFDGTPIAIAYAARFPDRVRKLVLWHPFVDGADWIPPQRIRGLIDLARTDWTLARHTLSTIWAPNGPVDDQRRLAEGFRESLTPDVFIRSLEAMQATNVVDDARSVQAETLVLSPVGAGVPIRYAQQVASLIPGATLVPVDQQEAFVNNDEVVPTKILRFLDGAAAESPSLPLSTGGTAIILFTDIVDSTALTERLGDAAFRERSAKLDAAMRRAITDGGGTAVEGKLLGDGVMAVFGGAREAIAAALACNAAAAEAGLELHLGIHAGDVIRDSGNVYGGAVNIASRISALSAPGEVLVSNTVRELARTSAGGTFEDRGEQSLKGIQDAVRVYAVRPSEVR